MDLVIDTDFASCFLCINKFNIVIDLYAPNIIFVEQVEEELKKCKKYYSKIKQYISDNKIKCHEFYPWSRECIEYCNLINHNHRIGKGEASAMAYCRYIGGILGSNNFSDIEKYCKIHKINIKSSTDTMIESFQKANFTEEEGNVMWTKMLNKGRFLPFNSFSEALKKHISFYDKYLKK